MIESSRPASHYCIYPAGSNRRSNVCADAVHEQFAPLAPDQRPVPPNSYGWRSPGVHVATVEDVYASGRALANYSLQASMCMFLALGWWRIWVLILPQLTWRVWVQIPAH